MNEATRVWLLTGLPGRQEGRTRTYRFEVGRFAYLPTPRGTLDLRIPERPARDAMGRPRYPEQAAWIEATLREQGIEAEAIWWSHWRFATPEAAHRFEALLRSLGAVGESICDG